MKSIDELRQEISELASEIYTLENLDYDASWEFCLETPFPEISKADFRKLAGENIQKLMEKITLQRALIRQLIEICPDRPFDAIGFRTEVHPTRFEIMLDRALKK